MGKKLGITALGVAFIALNAVSAPPTPKNPFLLWRAMSKPVVWQGTRQTIFSPGLARRSFSTPQLVVSPKAGVGVLPVTSLSHSLPQTKPPFFVPQTNETSCPVTFLRPPAARPEMLPRVVWQRVQAARQNRDFVRNLFPDRTIIDAVIFDMDGTLLDSLSAWDHAAARYLKTLGIEMPEEMEEQIVHMSLIEGAVYLKEQLNIAESPEELLEGTLAVVRQHYLHDVAPKAGVLPLLQQLHEQGIKISVATASDKELAERVFAKWGLDTYIDFVITCDEVGAGKLSPKIYEQALARLGTARGRTLVVEDALYALKTAKAAGFLTAGIAEPYHTRLHEDEVRKTGDYFFTSFEDSLK